LLNRVIAWSLQNRVIVLAVSFALFAAAWLALREMPVDVFPEFAPPQVVVQTEAPGMAPQNVETLITYPLETAINGTPGVSVVRSKTSAGLSTIVVVFEPGSDIFRARQLVNERIQSVIGLLPAGSEPPIMLPVTSAVGWLVKYALVSDTLSPEDLRTLSDWEIRPRLLALGGIASVVSIGGEVKQYQVRLKPERMVAYHISAEEIRRALELSNINVPGAFLQTREQELIVSGVGQITSLADLENTVIVARDGVPIKIKDVAAVGFGGEIKRGDGAFGMTNAVIGTVSKAFGADTLTTTDKVERELAEIGETLPQGVALEPRLFRQANFIEASVDNLTIALLQGALIVIAVLMLFLMNFRASFITFLSMPASFAGAVLAMRTFDVGINAMTLGGLAIAVGVVVDDAIVTVENVVRRLRLNRNLAQPLPTMGVVFDAVREIASSVVYATLILIVIFAPIFFLEDLAGRIFRPLGVSYIAAVTASLVVSLTMVPAAAYLLLVRPREKASDRDGARQALETQEPVAGSRSTAGGGNGRERETRFVLWLKGGLRRVLHLALPRFWWVVGLSGSGLVLVFALLPFFGRSFLPEFHEGNFIIAVTTLPGTSLEQSMRLGEAVRSRMLEYPQVISVAQRAGRSELDEDAQPPNFSEFDVNLDFDKEPRVDPDALIERIREDLAEIPGAAFNVGQFIAHRMDEVQSGVRAQVAIKIFGEDLSKLYQLGQQVEAVLRGVSGAVDVNLEQQVRVPQVTIEIDREKAARYGVRVGDVAQDIEMFLNGQKISSVLEGRRTFDLFVRLEQSSRSSVETIRDMLVDAPALGPDGSAKLPLRALADVDVREEPYSIGRENAQRLITVTFNVQGRDLEGVIDEVQAEIGSSLDLPLGYYVAYGGQFESQQQANRTLLSVGAMALFGALLLLYKAFGTFREAALVMLNLPLALIGGVVALFFAGAELSVAAMMGFITLFGIALRNGIILVVRYNQLRSEGKALREVVLDGTLDRLVPVLMTAGVAALGLLPLLWGSPEGKELERPLAQVVLGGLATSTLLNMVVIPTVYYHMEQWRERRRTKARAAT